MGSEQYSGKGQEPREARDRNKLVGKWEWKTQERKYSGLAERPKCCTDRMNNAMIWGLWPECNGWRPVDL